MAIIFGAGPSNDEWVTLIPPRAVSDALLYQYWLCVHPVARTIHRPSFAQRYETLWELIDGRDYIPASLGALVFSVLLSSVISMSAEDIVTRFHDSKQEMSSRLQLGTELALSKSNLLRSNKMEVLQALITYMVRLILCYHSQILNCDSPKLMRSHSSLCAWKYPVHILRWSVWLFVWRNAWAIIETPLNIISLQWSARCDV